MEIARRLRTRGPQKVAASLKIGVCTLLGVLDGGTVRKTTAERIEATVRKQASA